MASKYKWIKYGDVTELLKRAGHEIPKPYGKKIFLNTKVVGKPTTEIHSFSHKQRDKIIKEYREYRKAGFESQADLTNFYNITGTIIASWTEKFEKEYAE